MSMIIGQEPSKKRKGVEKKRMGGMTTREVPAHTDLQRTNKGEKKGGRLGPLRPWMRAGRKRGRKMGKNDNAATSAHIRRMRGKETKENVHKKK